MVFLGLVGPEIPGSDKKYLWEKKQILTDLGFPGGIKDAWFGILNEAIFSKYMMKCFADFYICFANIWWNVLQMFKYDEMFCE